jgi:hypothetical protein
MLVDLPFILRGGLKSSMEYNGLDSAVFVTRAKRRVCSVSSSHSVPDKLPRGRLL